MSDNLTDRLQRAADRFVAASLERGFIYGTVGRQNENGGYSVVVAGRPNYLYVTVDGEQASTIARAGATPRVAGLPVRMKREQGELVIVDVNQLALGAFLSGGAGGYNVAFHHHNEGSGLEYAINSSRLKPGRVRYVSALTVHIGEFAYSHLGDWRWWPGGNIDLTSVQPATADTWAWVLVGVDPSTNAAVAVAGASQATGTALTVDQLEAIAFNGYIPCGAVRVRQDDTALNLASRYADARIWLDRLGAAGGGDVAAEIDGATEKVAPDGTDKFGLVEGGLLKWLSWTNLVAGVQAAIDSVYFRLTGRAGGQAAHGGTGSGETLTLRGSAHATSGGVVVDDSLGIGGAPAASAALDIQGTTGAVLFPRLTSAQRLALTAADGMQLYDTSLQTQMTRNNGAWIRMATWVSTTWTPDILGSSSNPTVTYTSRTGTFTRIGNVIFFDFSIVINTISGGSGFLLVTLPTGIATTTRAAITATNVNFTGTPVTSAFLPVTGSGAGRIRTTADNGVHTDEPVSALQAGSVIAATGFYFE